MLGMTAVSRCVIPRFAQLFNRSAALTTSVLPRKLNGHLGKYGFATSVPKSKKETVTVHFICGDGTKLTTNATVGDNLLDVIIDNDVDIDGFDGKEKLHEDKVKLDQLCRDASLSPKEILLKMGIQADLDVNSGACEGTLACSTCHLIFKQPDYDKLPEEPSDEELDMLDLAYGLEDTSRLGCQIIVSKDMEGLTVKVPAGVADAREPS